MFCESKGHWAQECKKVTEVSERREKLKSVHCCFLCLNHSHNVRVCSKRSRVLCTRCKGAHHRSICNETEAVTTPTKETASTTICKIDVASPGFTYLQTARICVMGPTGLSKLTCCVLDAGSQSSFVARQFEIRGDWSPGLGGKCIQVTVLWLRSTQSCTLLRKEHMEKYHRTYHCLWKYSCPMPSPHSPSRHHYYGADSENTTSQPEERWRDLPIEVLIGRASTIRLSSLVLLPMKFGWILTGNRTGITAHQMMVNHITLEHSDNDLRRFWDLDTIGITPSKEKPLTTGDSQILQEFRDSYHIEDGCRVVRFPKKNICDLSSNRDTAERRFRTLQKWLQQDDALWTTYEEQMLDHIVKQQVELAPTTEKSTRIFYLPHHAVKKERHRKIKWRIVFNASSSEGNSSSLNDLLEMGPKPTPWSVSDSTMFSRTSRGNNWRHPTSFPSTVSGPEGYRPNKFFWYRISQDIKGNCYTTNEVVTYRFTRLPSSLMCSPFLLSATVRELATLRRGYPKAAPLIASNMFMDDFVAWVQDGNPAISIYYELSA